MKTDTDINDSKRCQLGQLQSRAEAHGARMWQLPLTFLAAIAASFTIIESRISASQTTMLFLVLAILGLIFLWCFIGAQAAYMRTCKELAKVEHELRLVSTTQVVNTSGYRTAQVLPYALFIVLGIFVCVYISLNPEVLVGNSRSKP